MLYNQANPHIAIDPRTAGIALIASPPTRAYSGRTAQSPLLSAVMLRLVPSGAWQKYSYRQWHGT